jgi:hypothetical protein
LEEGGSKIHYRLEIGKMTDGRARPEKGDATRRGGQEAEKGQKLSFKEEKEATT